MPVGGDTRALPAAHRERIGLRMPPCTRCGGHFVAHAQDVVKHLVCGLCQPPSRANATKANRKATVEVGGEGYVDQLRNQERCSRKGSCRALPVVRCWNPLREGAVECVFNGLRMSIFN
jgi:hypothetical protein